MYNVQNTNQVYCNIQPPEFFEIHNITLKHVKQDAFPQLRQVMKTLNYLDEEQTGPQNITLLVLKI